MSSKSDWLLTFSSLLHAYLSHLYLTFTYSLFKQFLYILFNRHNYSLIIYVYQKSLFCSQYFHLMAFNTILLNLSKSVNLDNNSAQHCTVKVVVMASGSSTFNHPNQLCCHLQPSSTAINLEGENMQPSFHLCHHQKIPMLPAPGTTCSNRHQCGRHKSSHESIGSVETTILQALLLILLAGKMSSSRRLS